MTALGEKELSLREKELELERKELELERKRLEIERQKQALGKSDNSKEERQKQALGKSDNSKEERADGGHLSLGSISVGMAVKVTDSKTRLQEACASSGILCTDDRVLVLGEAGRVTEVDAGDKTANIKWPGAGKSGWMPIACLQKAESVPEAPNSLNEDLAKAVLAAALLGAKGAGDACDAPHKRLTPGQGVHLHSDLKSIKVNSAKNEVVCLESRNATVFTEEVLSAEDSYDFTVKVGSARKAIVVGVTGKVPTGYSRLLLGEEEFKDTIGALCAIGGGMVMHGRPVAIAPAIEDGDLLCVRARRGQLRFLKNGASFFECQVSGGFRFAISMQEEGQTASLVFADAALVAGQLKAGRRVRLPPSSDERLRAMRVRWSSEMSHHCGAVGEVCEVKERCVRARVNGEDFLWDLELFDAAQQRFSPKGSELRPQTLTAPALCSVSKAWLPVGSQVLRCVEEGYVLSEYACGKPSLPGLGSKVLRGPTWKWGDQDGEAYEEGTVRSEPDGDGWFSVEWPHGARAKYRGPPYQDVLPAKENGLKGKSPPGEEEPDEQVHAKLREFLAAALLSKVAVQDWKELARDSFSEEQGWHFYQGLKSISVDDTRKVAVCKQSRDATVVTEEVFEASGEHLFAVKLCSLAEKPVVVGVVDDEPQGFSTHVIGHGDFKGCIGAMCEGNGKDGAMVHDGEIAGEAPGVHDGDVLRVHVRDQQCKWSLNGVKFHSCQIKGKFRFGLSFMQQGQSAEILSEHCTS